MEDGKLVCIIEFIEEEVKVVKGFFLLIIKFVLYVVNVDEDKVVDFDDIDYVN